MGDEILTKSFQRGMKRGISQRRAGEKSHCLVWPGAHMASKNKGCLRTHTPKHTPLLTGRAIPPTTLSPGGRKEATERREARSPLMSPRPRSAWRGSILFEEVWRTSALQFVACVHARGRLPVCALVSHPGAAPPYVGGWFGWECLASVSLPVSDTSAHITGSFVPNVTALRGRERIPSLQFPIALLFFFFKKRKKSFWTWRMMTLNNKKKDSIIKKRL